MAAAAKRIAARKFLAVLSYPVARYCLSLQKKFSIRWRALYIFLS